MPANIEHTIKSICEALKEEAEAISSYTEKLSALAQVREAESTRKELDLIRLDEVEHVQKLTLELTRLMMNGAPPTESGGEENE